jgi:hypothetical protein
MPASAPASGRYGPLEEVGGDTPRSLRQVCSQPGRLARCVPASPPWTRTTPPSSLRHRGAGHHPRRLGAWASPRQQGESAQTISLDEL